MGALTGKTSEANIADSKRRARPIWQVVSQNDEGILIEDNIWNLDKACQLLPSAKNDKNLFVANKSDELEDDLYRST